MPTTDRVGSRAKLLRGLAETSRLMILDALRDGEMTVTEICGATGLGQPNVSNHLACLLGCRLVKRERSGRFVRYRLSDERIAALLSLSEQVAERSEDGTCCPVCGSEAW